MTGLAGAIPLGVVVGSVPVAQSITHFDQVLDFVGLMGLLQALVF